MLSKAGTLQYVQWTSSYAAVYRQNPELRISEIKMCKLWRGTFYKQQSMQCSPRKNAVKNKPCICKSTYNYHETAASICYIGRIPTCIYQQHQKYQRHQEKNFDRNCNRSDHQLFGSCKTSCSEICGAGCTVNIQDWRFIAWQQRQLCRASISQTGQRTKISRASTYHNRPQKEKRSSTCSRTKYFIQEVYGLRNYCFPEYHIGNGPRNMYIRKYYKPASITSRNVRQNICNINVTNETTAATIHDTRSLYKEYSAENGQINQRAARRFGGVAIKLIELSCVYLLMLSSTLLLAKFRQLSPKVSSNLIIVLLIFLCACYVMTLKLAIIPPVIKESYAIYGNKSTQYMGLLFYDMCRFAVLSAYDCHSLVHAMTNCNSLEAIKSFDISTGNHGADINNQPTCRHNMKTSSDRSAAKNHGTCKNSKNSCNRFTGRPKTLEHAGDTSNNPSDEEHNTNDDSNDSINTNGTQSARIMNIEGIKIVHWNCRGANGKLSAIKDATQKDCIDILLLQDTRLSRRDDGLPKLRLHGYSTYDVPQSETSHGMVILVHEDIPSDLAQQFVFGPRAESLTIRIWICGSSYLIHNIYNNGATLTYQLHHSMKGQCSWVTLMHIIEHGVRECRIELALTYQINWTTWTNM